MSSSSLCFLQVCVECSEEFCSGTCREFQYDSYQRLIIEEKEKEGQSGAAAGVDQIGHKNKGPKSRKSGIKKKKITQKQSASNALTKMNI